MSLDAVTAVKYILSKAGCTHPFRISRILALAELKSIEDGGGKLTNAIYVEGPGVFFIEGLKELVDKDECIVKKEGDPVKGIKGCIELICSQDLVLPERVKRYLDSAIEESINLDDLKLNEKIVKHPLYKRLFS